MYLHICTSAYLRTKMIPPKKNILISGFFDRYIIYIVRRHFHVIEYNPVQVSTEKSVLLLPNHYSWWDGFLMHYLNKRLFKKKAHVMILEQTAKKFPFFKYIGAFTVQKGSRDVLTSLDFAARLLKDPNNLVLIFPQGNLYSNFTDDIIFQSGLSRVVKQASGDFQTVFAMSFIEHLQYKKPSVNINLQVCDESFSNIEAVQTAFETFYRSAKQQQSKIVV